LQVTEKNVLFFLVILSKNRQVFVLYWRHFCQEVMAVSLRAKK